MYNLFMRTTKPVLPLRWTRVLCILTGLYGVVVVFYIFIETGKPPGATDFHQFWYAGHFIFQGRDPYQAFFAEQQPDLPVHYLDGVTVNQYPVAQPTLEVAPSNTP